MSHLNRHPQGNGLSNNNQDIEGQGDSVKETTTQRTILGLIWNKIVQWWNRHVAFVLLCVIEVAMDPLFFYLPMINLEKKCIGFDKKLWIIAIVVRSVNDFIYLLHFIWQFRTVFIYKTKLRYLWPFLLDILVILPIPQVVIPIIFSEMSSSKSSKKLKVLNFIVFFQYGPRIFQIYRSWKRLITSDKKFDRNIPFKAPLNLILYIIAGHVLGAFWYFFSSHRLTSCWRIACEKHSECVQSSFNCDHSFGNDLSFLNDSCPIDPPNTTSFDFGIFREALQSHVSESTDFPQKLFYSFWWGMRNLSSFGSNLQTSNYIWEICFALCISIFGLILFLFFMGNLQMYMQWTTSKSINNWKKDLKRKKQEKNIESWMSKKALPSEMTKQIMEHIPKRYDEDEDVYVENLIPDLPPKLQGEVKHHICFDLLKNLNIMKERKWDNPRQVLLDVITKENICSSLKAVFYNEQSYIVQEGDPIVAIFLITEGTVWSSSSTSRNIIGEGTTATSRQVERLVKGQLFGEELLDWFWKKDSSIDMSKLILPVSSKTLKTHTKVEAFALMADDFKEIVSRRHDLDNNQVES